MWTGRAARSAAGGELEVHATLAPPIRGGGSAMYAVAYAAVNQAAAHSCAMYVMQGIGSRWDMERSAPHVTDLIMMTRS